MGLFTSSFAIVVLYCVCLEVAAAQRPPLQEMQQLVGEVGKNITLKTGLSKVPDGSDLLWSKLNGTEENTLAFYSHGQLLNHLTTDKFIGRVQLDTETGSLTIRDLSLNDSGIYHGQVFNTPNSHHWFNVTVLASVVKVSMELEGDKLTCLSRGIYPEPTLSWSTSPPTNHTSHNSTRVTKTTEGLYDVSCTLSVTAKDSRLDYICSVGTAGGGKTTTLRQLPPVHGYDSDEVEIPCEAPSSAAKDFSITWSFNHRDPILSYSSTSRLPLVQDQWKEAVKGVSESGALLLSASSGKLEGVYMCELCHADDTYVAYTTLKMEQKPGVSIGTIVGVTILAAVVIIGIIAVAMKYLKQRQGKNTSQQGTPAEMSPFQT